MITPQLRTPNLQVTPKPLTPKKFCRRFSGVDVVTKENVEDYPEK